MSGNSRYCTKCKHEEWIESYPLTSAFDTFEQATAAAMEASTNLGCDIFVDESNSQWTIVAIDSCLYNLANELIPNAEFDLVNSPHHFLGTPYFTNAAGLSFLDAVTYANGVILEIDQKLMVTPDAGLWSVVTSLNEEQNQTVARLTSYFEGQEFYDRKFDQIFDYSAFVRELAFSL